MKRCPKCLFIYPDSDSQCDFDNTPLVVVDEAELEAATGQVQAPAKKKRAPRKRRNKVTAIVAVIGLMLGVGAFLVYYSFVQANQDDPEIAAVAIVATQPMAAPLPAIESPAVVETPSPSPAPTQKASAERIATSHSSTTGAPVSTSGPGVGTKAGGKPVILLTTGGRIEADEVWRTRDGIWYRRAGIVTLLKRNKVKAIVDR
jgi:type IV secretory pathway VirB10-like protein